jgi:uncharacterized protein YfaP (DUF2135 family)
MSRLRLAVSVLCLCVLASVAGAREGQEALRIKITSPRGGQTSARLVEIKGEVAGYEGKRLTLVLNGVPLSIAHSGSTFATTQVIAPGWNTIRVRADRGTLHAEDEVAVFAQVPRKDLRIAMTWDTDGTDIDLWATGPDGEKVFYSNKQGKAGGTLDVDVTTGYGPETYTQARLPSGTYRVQAHYYGGAAPTRVTVTVLRGEGTASESRRIFRGILMRRGEVLEVGSFSVP